MEAMMLALEIMFYQQLFFPLSVCMSFVFSKIILIVALMCHLAVLMCLKTSNVLMEYHWLCYYF